MQVQLANLGAGRCCFANACDVPLPSSDFGWLRLQAECYDYLFESAIKLRGLGIDAGKPPAAAALPPAPLANGHAGVVQCTSDSSDATSSVVVLQVWTLMSV